jgi:hypothetical protein
MLCTRVDLEGPAFDPCSVGVSAWLPLDLDERLRQVPARLLSGQARLSELRAVL